MSAYRDVRGERRPHTLSFPTIPTASRGVERWSSALCVFFPPLDWPAQALRGAGRARVRPSPGGQSAIPLAPLPERVRRGGHRHSAIFGQRDPSGRTLLPAEGEGRADVRRASACGGNPDSSPPSLVEIGWGVWRADPTLGVRESGMDSAGAFASVPDGPECDPRGPWSVKGPGRDLRMYRASERARRTGAARRPAGETPPPPHQVWSKSDGAFGGQTRLRGYGNREWVRRGHLRPSPMGLAAITVP